MPPKLPPKSDKKDTFQFSFAFGKGGSQGSGDDDKRWIPYAIGGVACCVVLFVVMNSKQKEITWKEFLNK